MANDHTGIRDAVNEFKKARTIAAAVELFYENGYENTTLDAVANSLGVTKPFIYGQFNSKAELLGEICSCGIAKSLEAIDSVLSLQINSAEKLWILGRRFVKAVLKNQMHIAILFREEKNLVAEDLARINDMRRDFDRKLTDQLRKGVEAGEFTLNDPHIAALSIGGMVSWAYVWYRQDGRLSLDEAADEMARLIVAMVQARP